MLCKGNGVFMCVYCVFIVRLRKTIRLLVGKIGVIVIKYCKIYCFLLF
jgi:hypothetical protein